MEIKYLKRELYNLKEEIREIRKERKLKKKKFIK